MARSLFHDDFSDSIWTKHPANPVLKRDQPWAESHYICEPNILHVGGEFRLWFAQMFPPNGKTALGYATSPDGVTWTKHPGNPVVRSEEHEVHRPSVMRHDGVYYLYAVQHENDAQQASMRRWASRDGTDWVDEGCVMRVTQQWERGLSNMAVVVDGEGVWRMIYTGADAPPAPQFGYAWSSDGLVWTKCERNPVITGFYGGDPFMAQVGDCYYLWHSEAMSGSLRIVCRRSRDLIHWERVGGHAQINYTQPWERGVLPEDGGTVNSWYGHLTDATFCEAGGRVFLVYQGAQTPLGVATFDGTLEELARRFERPPLAQWEPSPFGMVEGCVLHIADSDSDVNPLVARVNEAGEAYVLQARIRCYAGPTRRVSVILRYASVSSFARLWLHDTGTLYYQERLNDLFSNPLPVGSARIADDAWHDWEVAVTGREVSLSIDDRPVGRATTSEALLRVLSSQPVHVGFSTHDTWASIARVRVWG